MPIAVRHDVPLLWFSQGLEITPARMLSTDSGMCSSPFDVCSVTIIRRPRQRAFCTSSTMLGFSHRAAGGLLARLGTWRIPEKCHDRLEAARPRSMMHTTSHSRTGLHSDAFDASTSGQLTSVFLAW